jgi:endo-1,4-beta-xylanase
MANDDAIELTRRSALLGAAATAALALAPPPLAAAPAKSLGALAAAKGLLFGASFSTAELDKPYGADYARIYQQDARVLTSELELKLGILRPDAATIDFSTADRLMAFADASKLAVRGHTLIWNDGNPDWIKLLGPGEAEHLLEAHIETVLDRYRDRIVQWDVVNEPIGPWDQLPGNLRGGPFYQALGFGYVARSFQVARKIDPKARLFLNEAQTESDDENGQTFRESFLKLVKKLHAQGVPIDGIGLQCHIDSARPYDFPKFAAYVNEFAELGYEIAITELDVNDRALPANIAKRDAAVADLYARFLKAVLPVKQIKLLTLWQMADHTSWLYYGDVEKNPGASRRPRPLVYDSNFKKKPAWDAVAAAFEAMPPR